LGCHNKIAKFPRSKLQVVTARPGFYKGYIAVNFRPEMGIFYNDKEDFKELKQKPQNISTTKV
jgi:hypothetical protein